MAQSHLPFRRLRVLLPRGPPGGTGQGDAARPTPKISSIHGGGLHRARVSDPFNLQLRRCARRRRSTLVQTGDIPRSFIPRVLIGDYCGIYVYRERV